MTQVERRRWWTAVHRYAGLGAMLFLLIASVTGVALSFRDALDTALNPDLFRSHTAQPIDPLAASRALAQAHPEVVITALPAHGQPFRTLAIGVAARPGAPPLDHDTVFVDADDGHVRGVRDSGPGLDRRHLIAGVFEFHYTLVAGKWGRWLMGVAALAWLVGNLVGLYLTLPLKGAFWRQWKRTWQFRMSSSLPRLLLDLHRASALWLLGGVTALALTSVCMNFFDEAFTPVVKALSPSSASLYDREPSGPPPAAPAIDAAGALAIGARENPWRDWHVAKAFYDPARAVYRILFTDDGVENYHGLGPVSLYVDGRSGRVIELDDPYRDSAGRKFSRALYPVHTGKVAGTIGIAVVILCGLATIETIVTGLYLWLKRRRPRVMARRARRQARVEA